MNPERLQLTIEGAVQGVGFRPFIYRLATELNLVGWVNNSAQGVFIEVEGNREVLESFLTRLQQEKPPRSQIQFLEVNWLDQIGYTIFEIRPSVTGKKTAVILPDLSTCSDCLQEIFNPNNRRYYYPFTNCTNCGPRYTIIEAIPYDRCHTTMQDFSMCSQCQAEYENPLNRRFHAQPNACSSCGPHLELWDQQGQVLDKHNQALLSTVKAIKAGKIVAIKGLGGFHLVVDAGNNSAVKELRKRKQRPDKPLALMYPSLDLIKIDCEVNELEEKLLLSPESPIVLLKRKSSLNSLEKREILAESIAPENPYLGVMLPYTPLHHLLMQELGFPIVATSGNLSDEPICIDEQEALERLGNIADLFLVHNRPIARPVDDSVVCIMGEREMILRRGRGYAPLPITINNHSNNSFIYPSILAVGGQLKNTVAITHKNQVFISQHIGDLTTKPAFEAFEKVIDSLKKLYEFEPTIIACDAHPDYLSTQFALRQNLPIIKVQHHYAHILSCLGENELEPPVLGIAWDGTGYGDDGTIWGGEFLLITNNNYQRVAHFRSFKLPGGEKAIKEPRRIALGLLYELFGEELDSNCKVYQDLPIFQTFSAEELILIKTMLSRNLNAPITSSVGRLFDGISALLGICQQATFEGQAAMKLEFDIADIITDEYYTFEILHHSSPMIVDWQKMIREIIADFNTNMPLGKISAKFHNMLGEIILKIAQQVGEKKVLLTGGCFQNRYLTERAIQRLRQENFFPYWHQRIPPNDGGLVLGQVIKGMNVTSQ